MKLLETVVQNEHLIYVADSRMVDDELISGMISDGMTFLVKCPEGLGKGILEHTLAEADLNCLKPVQDKHSSDGGSSRELMEIPIDFNGTTLRAILVRTEQSAERADRTVSSETKCLQKAMKELKTTYDDRKDAMSALDEFKKKFSGSIYDIDGSIEHGVKEWRSRGRPRADGTDVRRKDIWTLKINYILNPKKEDMLRRRSGLTLLISNAPNQYDNPEHGQDAEGLMLIYNKEKRVGDIFKAHKERNAISKITIRDPKRIDAFFGITNMAAVLRGMMHVMIKKGLGSMNDDALMSLLSDDSDVERTEAENLAIDRYMGIELYYDDRSKSYGLMKKDDENCATIFLNFFGLNLKNLF